MAQKRTTTARARLVAALTDEILQNPERGAFPIASENQLCRQFGISRVTVRLALSDLENRGLIYRKHGKGTFAHGRSERLHKNLGVLVKAPQATEHRPISEMVQGAQNVMASVRAGVLLISLPPEEWRAEMASSLGGVIVVPQDVTERDLEILRNRHLPYLLFAESALPGPSITLGQRAAARTLTEQLLQLGHRRFAILSGFDSCLDAPKRWGVHDALKAAGIDPARVPEFSAHNHEGDIFQATRSLLALQPRPTAVVAFDDSLGSILSFQARRQEGIQVPQELSIVSFHDWPYLNYIEPALTTVRFKFFAVGQKGAEALNLAALTGRTAADLSFDPIFRPGQTVGPASGTD
ncbi:MAG: GntR family transcriptional regulator [Methylacidiphilales bacterium]|nr:GntR family transcriptional regulator [Candidatus Methylacidiphilales bacterium]